MARLSAVPALMALAMGAAVAAAPVLPPQPPVEMLPLTFDDGRLGGAGGARLQADLKTARFVALGEDHGFAGPPQLATALARAWAGQAGPPVVHAVEVGPLAAEHAAGLLRRDGLAGLDRLIDAQPGALPFLALVEDAELALPFARAGRLWGIDQEFVGSAPLLYEWLAQRTPDPAVQAQLQGWAKADRAALASGTFSALSLNTVPLDQFAALKAGYAGDGKAQAMLDALVASARIYQLNETERYFENNQVRSDLMVRQFTERYRAAAMPRVLVKAGAFHMGRGISPTGVFDLGSFLPGLAAAAGRQSLHIAMVPYTGRVRSIAPGPQGFTKLVDHKEDSVAQLLAAAGLTPEQLPASGHVLIPLAPIRQRLGGKARRELPEFTRFMVMGFDYLVITRDAAPATHFEAWTPPVGPAR